MPPQRSGLDADVVFRALAEPRRRSILSLVASVELPAGKIAEHFDVSRSAISQHLQVLKDAGLITERRDGTRRLYRASEVTLVELRAYLEGLWRQSFELARDVLEETPRSEGESAAAG
ncbi:ArsR/SmtB family transcription factor [Actinomadura welshii]